MIDLGHLPNPQLSFPILFPDMYLGPSQIMAWTSRSPLDSVPWMSHSSSDAVLQMQAITLKPHSKQATSLLLLINGTTAYPFAQAGNLDWFLIVFLPLRKKRFKNTGLWAPWRDTELMSGVTLSHGDPVAEGLGLEPALPIDHPTTHFKRWKLRWKFIAGLTFVHRFWCSRALFTHLFWFGLNKLIHL